jgi:hypothetical protein
MKTEELIKKAAERGVTLDEATAEKYCNLSDEELANLDISGGGCKNPTPTSKRIIDNLDEAATCIHYDSTLFLTRTGMCLDCFKYFYDPETKNHYCTYTAPKTQKPSKLVPY